MNKLYQPVKSNEECEKIIAGTFQGVLCMTDEGEPYALPINHAFHNGRFYFHCAARGRKLDVIAKNPAVTYVISKYYGDQEHRDKSMKCHGFWESVIAYGTAKIVSEREELLSAFKTFMAYYGRDDLQQDENLFERTRAIVIEVNKMTARREYEENRTDYWYWEKE
jgi:uncharacterized protein